MPAVAPSTEPAAAPAHELWFSESIAHWLAQGDDLPAGPEGPAAAASAARAAGRRRDIALIGGAALLATLLAFVLHGRAGDGQRGSDARPPRAAALTRQAEGALSLGRAAEALELARRALAADARFADAYVVLGSVHQNAGRAGEARAAYHRYLELAPAGHYAARLRDQLAGLGD